MAIEYDVAISFAGEDRSYAEALADFLANEFGLAVFYDDFEQARLFGTFLLEKLVAIYRDKSQYCVVLVSQHYKDKRYTRHEWRSAQERAFREPDKDYLLPVRLDDTELPGLFETISYIDGTKTAARTVARLVYEKVGDFSKISARVRLADQKYREGLVADALEIVRDKQVDHNIDALRVRADCYGYLGDNVNALAALNAILAQRPRDFLSHFLAGIFSFRAGDFAASVRHYETADAISPGHPTIKSDLPLALAKLAGRDDA
ncbi:TIR domain-containing protein [Ahniella affigens]|nr:TIR domain-containing protein [Ahniella affigens]